MQKRNKLFCGIGLNDAEYVVSKVARDLQGKRLVLWTCPYYIKWTSMINRCYSESELKRRTSYVGCSVCEEWLTFSNFKAWMENQDWEGKELDKDLLVKGNKIYSPDTCIFLSKRLNSFLTESTKTRGDFPIGVRKHRDKFISSCRADGKLVHLGLFETPEQAHKAWLKFKAKEAKRLSEQETDERVINALISRYI